MPVKAMVRPVPPNEANRVKFDDLIRGTIEMPENDEDIVLLKSDGIPTYHFAHAVDDHLMRTTHVLRGTNGFPPFRKHLQLFRVLGFKAAEVRPYQPDHEGGQRRKAEDFQAEGPRSGRSVFRGAGISRRQRD